MNNKQLYIIGNGFDIFHGIKSRYSDFKDYVKENDNDLFQTLNEYFNSEKLWSDFEETLANIDTEKIVDDASDFLVSYSTDDWSDAYHHDYQYEVQRAIDIVTVTLKKYFTKWILNLNIPNDIKLKLPISSLYINFNYTITLEKNYKIPSSNIFYIHNKAIDETSTLILGHSRQPSRENSFNKEVDMEDEDVRIMEGNKILDRYFIKTYKNTNTIIKENQSFFNSLQETEQVFVLGHSISTVDIKYFQEVLSKIKKDSVWIVSYYGNKEKRRLKNTLIENGVSLDKIEMIKLTEF